MCRLLIASRDAVTKYNKTYGLANLLFFLEAQCGGHGNGIVLVKDRKITTFAKAVNLKIPEISKIITQTPFAYLLFHTRIASVSSQSDENCHPYVSGDDALAMNGTEYALKNAGEAVGKTDSELIFDLVKNRKLSYTNNILRTFSSVFVGFNSGLPYAHKNSGALEEWICSNPDDFMFASSFPLDVKGVDELYNGFSFWNGKRTKRPVIRAEPIIKLNRTGWSHKNRTFKSPYPYDYLEGIVEDDCDVSLEDAYEEGYAQGYQDAANRSQAR